MFCVHASIEKGLESFLLSVVYTRAYRDKHIREVLVLVGSDDYLQVNDKVIYT